MLRRTFLSGLVLAAATPALLATEAQAATWVFLGSTRVNGLVDFDRIHVGAGKGSFDKLRLKVVGNHLMIYDLDVRYGNGVNDDIPVRMLIPEGGMTRVIDLRASNRFIRTVRFTYGKFANGNGPTYVELYGRR
ncbi:MAG TPA: hypothetical protein GYA10_14415 [Alphaproteobacteria bacterium]|nr:hypothetical protein [Alphaproteobacteria bacterium]